MIGKKKSKSLLVGYLLATLMFTAIIRLPVNSMPLSLSINTGDRMEFIVGVENRLGVYGEIENLIQKYDGQIINTISTADKLLGVVVSLPSGPVLASCIAEIKSAELSRYVEPNEKIKMVQYEPNDPEWRNQTKQWSLWSENYGIRANWAWNTTLGTHAVRVAVVDSGIDYTHEDLSANYIGGGYDFVNNDTDPMDDLDHGTHCAGIIAAQINNGKGIAGIAQVELVAEKCIDSNGFGTYSNVASAIIHAVDSCNATIVSMSLGFLFRSQAVYDAIKHAYDKGALLVAAAGNDGWEGRSYPAAFKEVIGVSGTDVNGNLGGTDWHSSYGDWLELAAPGDKIYSTIGKRTRAANTIRLVGHPWRVRM